MRKWCIYIATFLMLVSCEEIIDSGSEETTDEYLVVDALITNESKRHLVRLTAPMATQNATAEGVSGAVVVINDGDTTLVLEEDRQNPGDYYTPVFRAVFGKVYTLGIFYLGREYFGQATSAFGEPLKPVATTDLEDGMRKYEYVATEAPSMQQVRIEWAENGQQRALEGMYYTLNVVDINRIFAPPKEEFEFPAGATITRRQFSLTDRHAEFLRSMLSETDWRGGFFDLAPGNVVTNLSEGARGFFAVCMVTSDSTLID